MSAPPQVNTPSPKGADIPWTTEPPTQPGTYWFKREPTSRAMMMDVGETDGALTVTVPVVQPGPTSGDPERSVARPDPAIIGTRKPVDSCHVVLSLDVECDAPVP